LLKRKEFKLNNQYLEINPRVFLNNNKFIYTQQKKLINLIRTFIGFILINRLKKKTLKLNH